ncbi:MAG: RNA 2'-phosphotransferase [Saprospiraceae bacterium]|nr:RNA 2'-phosphotransferase [Saprospiraceae bacterium]MCB9326786.1 RNA 2'-phosphotransferase [Lewinellaceae bacterium]
MNNDLKKISKKMSYALRHAPEKFGLQLDAQGWCQVQDLLSAFRKKGIEMTQELLDEVVEKNDKKRFAFDDSRSKIRASQGHSIPIDLGYEPVKPPDVLFHGTARQHLDSILREGLQKRNRHHVHLSPDRETATRVGGRHGKAVVLLVNAKVMHEQGIPFYRSSNGVWLTESVAPEFLSF